MFKCIQNNETVWGRGVTTARIFSLTEETDHEMKW